MANIIDDLTWIQDGEKADATVFNRALKELATKIDKKTFDFLSSTNGFAVDVTEINTPTVSIGDFVYRRDDGIYDLTLGNDNIKDKVVGRWIQIDSIDIILFGGITNIITDDMTAGTAYYLSTTDEGKLTNTPYNSAVLVGTAINSSKLLMSLSRNNIRAKEEESNIERVDKIFRLDKQFENLDINNIEYDNSNRILSITYSTGNKEVMDRTSGDLDNIKYYDKDGSTLLSTNTMTYDNNNRLITSVWINE
jgi:hypothetical protein